MSKGPVWPWVCWWPGRGLHFEIGTRAWVDLDRENGRWDREDAVSERAWLALARAKRKRVETPAPTGDEQVICYRCGEPAIDNAEWGGPRHVDPKLDKHHRAARQLEFEAA